MAQRTWGGNMWEWCRTKYVKNYQNYEIQVDEKLDSDEIRVLRGGAFDYDLGLRALRLSQLVLPNLRGYFIGFRVVSPVPLKR